MVSKSTVKYIQSLQHKKFRDEYNQFVAEGPKLVTGLLEHGIFPLKAVYALPEWLEGLDEQVLHSMEGRVEAVKDFELEKLASYTTANKVVAVFEKRPAVTDINCRKKLTIALDDIQDPGNLGTIIRTADWFGIENMVCSEKTADMYNPKVVQGTMASLGRVNIIYTDLPLWLSLQKGNRIYAAALNGRPVKEIGRQAEGIIVIGNESKGISEKILDMGVEKITIPKKGHAESLNAAVAAGIILSSLTGGQ